MASRSLLCLLPALVLAAVVGAVLAAENPHVEPAECPACHVKVPTADDGERGDYFLTRDTIDDTCHICHEYGCCKPGSLHGNNHPSNINSWDWKLFRRPKTLPLFGGYITCDTCHFHREAQGNAYKLVRIVKVEGKKADWAELCRDCHTDY